MPWARASISPLWWTTLQAPVAPSARFRPRAQADGYTLMAGTPGIIHLYPAMQLNLRYSAENDFVPVSQLSDNPMVMVVNKDSPFNSVNELLAA